jgi:hypothetical protein
MSYKQAIKQSPYRQHDLLLDLSSRCAVRVCSNDPFAKVLYVEVVATARRGAALKVYQVVRHTWAQIRTKRFVRVGISEGPQ